jgi:hypothetical protein
MNFDIGMSSSEAQSNEVGPFTTTAGDWIVGGGTGFSAPRATATNWGMLAMIAGAVVLGVVALVLFLPKGRR